MDGHETPVEGSEHAEPVLSDKDRIDQDWAAFYNSELAQAEREAAGRRPLRERRVKRLGATAAAPQSAGPKPIQEVIDSVRHVEGRPTGTYGRSHGL